MDSENSVQYWFDEMRLTKLNRAAQQADRCLRGPCFTIILSQWHIEIEYRISQTYQSKDLHRSCGWPRTVARFWWPRSLSPHWPGRRRNWFHCGRHSRPQKDQERQRWPLGPRSRFQSVRVWREWYRQVWLGRVQKRQQKRTWSLTHTTTTKSVSHLPSFGYNRKTHVIADMLGLIHCRNCVPQFAWIVSDHEPYQLIETLDHHLPQTTKCGLIGSSTPFITGTPYTLFYNGKTLSGGTIGFVSSSTPKLQPEIQHHALEVIGRQMTITR